MARRAKRFRGVSAGQARHIAEERYKDAKVLLHSPNRRYSGALYLSGLVLDCLFKAKLLEKYPEVAGASPQSLSEDHRFIQSLIFRSHDLAEMLAYLPEILQRLSAMEEYKRARLTTSIRMLCDRWTIQTRYSTQPVPKEDAEDFFDRLTELKPWLR